MIPTWLIDAIPSIISGVFGFGSSMATNSANARGVESANQANKELMQMQNQFNVQQWQRQQEYNTPRNQMQRLQDAGINPALAYTNGVQGNISSTAPSASSTPTMVSSTFLNPFTELMDSILKNQQLKNAKAEENLTKAQEVATYKSVEVSEHTILNINSSTDVNKQQLKNMSVEAEKAAQEVEKVRKEIELLGQEIDAKEFENWFNKITRNSQVRQKMLECDMTEQQLKNMCAQLLNINADTRLKGAQYNLATIQYEDGKLNVTTRTNGWRGKTWYDNTKSIFELIGTVFSGGFSVSK